ncbi:MAG: class I SAM-dependent methyltransferase, partial [Pyrinomonadaceae bacterium]
LYASFEDQFRGTRADIKARLKVYLPYLERAAVTGGVVDLGCGRGEWLEVLREAGEPARGVDRNRVTVEQCRARGFEVVEADMLDYLRGLPENSMRAVTAFHLIEHLPFQTLIDLLGEVLRVLAPGGLVIFETPNPENLVVGASNFYLDPDHRNPLPSPLMHFLLETRGFCRVEVVKLNANDAARVRETSDLALRFNDFMYGPLDYAVIGWKV